MARLLRILTIPHPLKTEIDAVRRLVLSADPRLREHIKWNAPSYAITDDLVTFKLRPQETLQLVMHTGAKKRATPLTISITDPAGLLYWVAADRGIITFSTLDDIEVKGMALVALVRQWIAQVQGAPETA